MGVLVTWRCWFDQERVFFSKQFFRLVVRDLDDRREEDSLCKSLEFAKDVYNFSRVYSLPKP